MILSPIVKRDILGYLAPQSKESCRERFDKKRAGRDRDTERQQKVQEKSRRSRKRQGRKHNRSKLGPQSGIIPKTLAKMSAVRDIVMERDFMERAEPVIDMVENIYLLIQNLRKAADMSHAVHLILAHVKLFTKKSLSGWIVRFLTDDLGFCIRNRIASDELNGFVDTDLSDVLDIQEGEVPQWLQNLKSFQFNWGTMVNCKGGETLCKVVSMCAALGMCDLTKFDVEYGPMKIFSLRAYDKQITAADFSTAILDTVVFFAEGGYRVFESGRLESFFVTDSTLKKAEARYFEIVECAPLVKAGNLERVKQLDDNDYSLLLDTAINEHTDLFMRATDGWVKKSLQDRLTTLKRYKADFNAYCADGGQRMAPYAIYVHGRPGVGKSTVYDVLIRLILQANGFNADDERIVTIKDGDDYDSTMRSSTNGAIFDDLGNTQAQYTRRSPTDRIIEFKNNVAAYANMAEVDMKGKVRIGVKAMAATSNVTARGVARVYSNAPFSFVRRFDTHLNVSVKEEFSLSDGRLDSKKVTSTFGNALIPDCFKIDVGIPDENNKEENVEFIRRGASFSDVVKYVIEDSRKYFASQRLFLERTRGLADKLKVCDACHMPPELCSCSVCKKLDVQVGEDSTEIEPLITEMLRLDRESHGVLAHIPEWVFENPYASSLLLWLRRHQVKFLVMEDLNTLVFGVLVLAYMFLWLTFVPSLFFLIAGFCIWIFLRKYYVLRQEIGQRITRARGLMTQVHRNIIARDVKELMYRSVALYAFYRLIKVGAAYAMVRTKLQQQIQVEDSVTRKCAKEEPAFIPQHWRAFREVLGHDVLLEKAEEMQAEELDAHGNIKPSVFADVKLRDSQVNPWAEVNVSAMPRSEKGGTLTTPQLINIVSKNLYFMQIHRENSVAFCDALFIKSCFVLIPNHMWKDKTKLTVDFLGKNRHTVGAKHKVILSLATSYRIPDTDLCLCYAPNAGSMKDLTPYLFDTQIKDSALTEAPAHMVYRGESGSIQLFRALLTPGIVNSKIGEYHGFNYNLGTDTFDGLCMGTWVTSTKVPTIVAFHLAGKTGTRRGAAGCVSRSALQDAMEIISAVSGVVQVMNQGTLLTEQYGKEFFVTPAAHPRSPINYLTDETNVDFYGSVLGRVDHTNSRVTSTLISDVVEEECGVGQQWGKPKFHRWKPWQQSLSYSSNPSRGFDGGVVARAVDDYLQPLLGSLKDSGIQDDIRPLTRMETVCGLDGKRFIDKMPPNTSNGYPLGGKKKDILTKLDPDDFPGFMCPAELDEVVWKEVERIEACYLDDERAYPVFKGCLKDEPTPLVKDKVRVFQAAPIAFQCAIRKYFLPVARYVSMTPLESECAVGINAQGPEWDELARHLRSFGSERILAGDYSKYDLRMPAQIILAAFDVLMRIAHESGNYSARDLQVMRGIATDVAYPLMAYNGDLIQHYGSNPSGQNLTVYINSIVNSLLMRCAFYTIHADKDSFRQYVALITYGDDVKGSVSPETDGFNHIAVADYLAAHDMKFTMPDKESEPTKFMKDEEADLLKRKNVYNERLGMFMGALSEDSIFKSLHAVLSSREVTPEQHAAINIDGALREWFLHGEELYEKRREQMRRVAQKCDIAWLCKELDVSYNERLERHCERYNVKTIAERLDEQGGESQFEDAEIHVYTSPPSISSVLTEATQLELTDQVFLGLGFSCMGKNIALFDLTVGEVDAVYHRHHAGQRQFILIEAKLRAGRRKARKQLSKYGKVMELLQPTSHIRTYMMIGEELIFIRSYALNSTFEYPDNLC